MTLKYSGTLLFLLSATSLRAACPTWINDPSVPLCPAPRTAQMVPETYPALAYVVSESATIGPHAEPSAAFVEDTVMNIFAGTDKTGRLPMIFLPVHEDTFNDLKKSILENTLIPKETRQKWAASLTWVPSRGFSNSHTWQQDYFESFVGPEGRPVVRDFESYTSLTNDKFKNLGKTMAEACPMIKTGSPLFRGTHPAGGTLKEAGEAGGNTEALPGGLCLHGDNQDPAVAAQYCGDAKNEVVIKSNWLLVGHVDEIVNIVPNRHAKAPCDFSVMLASPKRGLDALSDFPEERLFQFKDHISGRAASLEQGENPSLVFCQAVRKYQDLKRAPVSEPEEDLHSSLRGPKKWFHVFDSLLSQPAFAGIVPVGKESAKSKTTKDLNWNKLKCADIKNSEAREALENDPTLSFIHKEIQKNMDEAMMTIRTKLKDRLQCSPAFVEVPQIFSGSVTPKIGDIPATLENATSLFPNPANGIMAGKTYIAPSQQNQAFDRAVKAAYQSAGVEVVFQDSWAYAHVRNGNIHCSTHMLPVCRLRP